MNQYICDNCGASIPDGHIVHDPSADETDADTFYCGPCFKAALADGLPEGAVTYLKSEDDED